MRVIILMMVTSVLFQQVTLVNAQRRETLDQLWEKYKKAFHKVYKDAGDDAYRRSIWEANVDVINKHNIEEQMRQHSYKMGINHLTDMTQEEYEQTVLDDPMTDVHENVSRITINGNDLPSTVDWRAKGYVTPVKNQGYCGGSWAFATTGGLEGQHMRKTKNLVSLSEQNLIDCSRDYGTRGCNGLGYFVEYGYNYIARPNGGIDTEASYPYQAKDDFPCRFKAATVGAHCTGFDLLHISEDILKTAVALIGPITVCVDSRRPSFRSYKSGVYDDPSCTHTKTTSLVVVGYGHESGKDYWLAKNSWGTKWGMKGYIKMSRNKHNQCGIADYAVYPKVF